MRERLSPRWPHRVALLLAFAAVLSLPTRTRAADADSDYQDPPSPLTYESVTAWQKKGALDDYDWPKKWLADLRQNGTEQVFLGIGGYSRGMTYAVFTKDGDKWKLIADQIEGSDHPFEILPDTHDSWHDFKSTLPSGRGGVLEFIYTWKGGKYVEKSEDELTAQQFSHLEAPAHHGKQK